MVTLTREANLRRLPPKLWHPALFAYETRNTALLTTPVSVLPPLFQDTASWRPAAKWNSAVHFVYPNTLLFLPIANPSVPTRAPELPVPPAPRRNASVYFDQANNTLNMQAGFIGYPVRSTRFDPTQRMTARRPLNIEYLPNTALSLLTSNPYVPVDLSGRVPAAKRNASLNFDSPNITIRLGIGNPPIRPVDLTPRFPIRQRITFDAPNLTSLLSAGNPPIAPPDINLVVLAQRRCASLYEAQGTLLTTSLFVPGVPPLTPGSDVDYNFDTIILRYSSRRILTSVLWNEPQRAILAKPGVTANIPNLFYSANTGVQTYNTGTAFVGATSYSIAPGLDAGITFNTVTGLISIDTGITTVATHGPYTVTATNTNGSVNSNTFTVTISSGNYHVDGPRVTESTTSLGATYTVSGPGCTRDTPESKDLT